MLFIKVYCVVNVLSLVALALFAHVLYIQFVEVFILTVFFPLEVIWVLKIPIFVGLINL